MDSVEKELRRALQRLRRTLEKAEREVDALHAVLQRGESDDFPSEEYADARRRIGELRDWIDQETGRLRMKILESGGIEPGRIRRSSGA